jgi:hypothetical protein
MYKSDPRRRLYNPSLYEVFGDDSGLGVNREYVCWTGVTWDEAKTAAEDEVELLEKFAGDPDGIEQLRTDAFEEEEEADSLYPLDLGVGGAVFAVSAAGLVPISSCNGLSGHLEIEAMVVFASDESRYSLVKEAAARSVCDLFLEGYGDGSIVVVQSADWRRIQQFGVEIRARAAQFDRCASVATSDQLTLDDSSDRVFFSNQVSLF